MNNRNNFSWGRESSSKSDKTDVKESTSAYKSLFAGVLICLFFVICITSKSSDPTGEGVLRKEEKKAAAYLGQNEYVAAMLGLEENRAASKEEQLEDSKMTVIEPFGYLDGEWNLWEYIGDSLSSLLFGS